MIELSPIFSMAEEGYTERLWTMVKSLVIDIADDAVGVGEWKNIEVMHAQLRLM